MRAGREHPDLDTGRTERRRGSRTTNPSRARPPASADASLGRAAANARADPVTAAHAAASSAGDHRMAHIDPLRAGHRMQRLRTAGALEREAI